MVLEKTIQTYKLWLEFYKHIDRKLRFSLVKKTDDLLFEIIELIFTAGISKIEEKQYYIEKSLAKLDILKLFLRILWETKAIDNKKYMNISKPLNEIGKMLGSWNKNLLK